MPTAKKPAAKTAAAKTTSTRETTRRAAQSNASKYGQGWGGGEALVDITCPSGATVEVRRVGLQGLIKMGVLDSLDSLTAIVGSEVIPNAEGRKPVDPAKMLEDPQKLVDATEMLDKIVLAVVTQPTLEKKDPEPDENGIVRYDPDKFYLSFVDIEDKTFIMGYVMGGTKDVETFRAESRAAVEGA